jgi:hypothetical protein
MLQRQGSASMALCVPRLVNFPSTTARLVQTRLAPWSRYVRKEPSRLRFHERLSLPENPRQLTWENHALSRNPWSRFVIPPEAAKLEVALHAMVMDHYPGH